VADDKEILEELRQIRKLLEPKPAPAPAPEKKGIINEFIAFFLKYKILGMTVAFIIGIYLGALIQSLVNDLIMPIIQLAMPGSLWETMQIGPFRIGLFIGALITFLIVLLIVFVIVKMAKRFSLD